MTLNDIDKQFSSKFVCACDDFGHMSIFVTLDNKTISDCVKDDLLNFIHQIYTQAKAEQKEEDAKVAESKKIDPKSVIVGNIHYVGGVNTTCDDIAKAIREAK